MSGALQSVFANFRSSAAPSVVGLVTNPTERGRGVANDSANNLIVVSGYYIQKFDSSGVLVWAKAAASDGYMITVAVDSNDNIYAAGETNAHNGFIIKFDSSGNVQWQKTQTPAPATYYSRSMIWNAIAVDSSNNVYVGGTWINNNQQTACCCGTPITYKYTFGYIALAKYDSSGTFQWATKFGSTDPTQFPNAELTGDGLCIDASDNPVVSGGAVVATSGNTGMPVLKYNSSGTYQWGYTYSMGATTRYGIVVSDSSSNIYCVSTSNSNSTFLKVNSSGTSQWTKSLSGGVDRLFCVAFDRTNNYLYVGGGSSNQTGGQNKDYIFSKLDSSGSLQYSRTMGFQNTTAEDEAMRGMVLSSDNKIVFAGQAYIGTSNVPYDLYGRVPTDGSKTGTYTLNSNPLKYASITLTPLGPALTTYNATATAFVTSSSTTLTYTDASAGFGWNTNTPTYSKTLL